MAEWLGQCATSYQTLKDDWWTPRAASANYVQLVDSELHPGRWSTQCQRSWSASPILPTSATTAPVLVSLHALRPVLPRPQPPLSSNGHVASPAHPHNHRFSHGSAFFSPYGRAWEEYHYSSKEGHADSLSGNGLTARQSLDLVAWSSESSGHQKTFSPSPFPDLQDSGS